MVIPLFDDLAFSMNLLFFKRPETNLINFLGKIPRALPRAVQPHITRKLGVKKGGSTSPRDQNTVEYITGKSFLFILLEEKLDLIIIIIIIIIII